MVVIRLARGGSKKRPFYHFVAANKRSPRDGRYIERLGYFNPLARGEELECNINIERLNYWISTGAQMSPRVRDLVKKYSKTESQAA